jgi:O-antigen ligase
VMFFHLEGPSVQFILKVLSLVLISVQSVLVPVLMFSSCLFLLFSCAKWILTVQLCSPSLFCAKCVVFLFVLCKVCGGSVVLSQFQEVFCSS